MSVFDDELHGLKAPKHLQDFVVRMGGKTPFGNPRYRLVWAPSVRHKAYGVFSDWEDHLEPSERGGLLQNPDGSWDKNPIAPQRVVEEMRWLETYPFEEGWLLERWYPAHMFGSPEKWGDCPLLGPYPEMGRYVDCCNAMKVTPSILKLEQLIQAIEYKIANKEGTMQQRIVKRTAKLEEAAQKRKAAAKQLAKDMLHERTTTILGSSLEAGRLREGLANRMRARGVHVGHVGA